MWLAGGCLLWIPIIGWIGAPIAFILGTIFLVIGIIAVIVGGAVIQCSHCNSTYNLTKSEYNLFNIKINKSFIYEEKINKYTKEELINIANNLAKKKIEESLEKDEEILLQKTLKIKEDNDKIYVEVFFKVYEDIAELQEIKP